MNSAWNVAIQGVGPHAVAVALCAARLFPVAFLCPLLGGSAAPSTVRLGLVLSLAGSLHVSAGVSPAEPVETAWQFLAMCLCELVFGTTMGFIAALPFDAARMGGRMMDLFRGASAESALPLTGTKEAATGDMLYQLLVTLVVTGGGYSLLLSALWKSFAAVRLGGFVMTEHAALHAVQLAGTALATGLAIGAPIAAVSLLIDGFLGLAARGAPSLQLQELAAPIRILAGGVVLWMGLGAVGFELLDVASNGAQGIHALFEVVQ